MSSTSEQDFIRSQLRRFQRLPAVRRAKDTLRAARRMGPSVWWMATSHRRQLPDLVIIGAQKSGTTQLYASMVRHPACFGGIKKEVHYFSKHRQKSLAWYRSHFSLHKTVAAAGGICIEASPSYIPSPTALQQMHQVMPETKVVVLLRDPVARAFSHYQHCKTRRLESRSFIEVVDEIIRNRAPSFVDDWLDQATPEPLYDYIARGYYALQLERLWSVYDREQTLVLDSADLFDDTDAVTQQVFDFAGLDRYPVPPKKIYNRGHYRETINPAVAQRLRQHYSSHDERLMHLLGQPLRWMSVAKTDERVAA